MLIFKAKYDRTWHRVGNDTSYINWETFDSEARRGQHGKLVRIDFDEMVYYYKPNIGGYMPTEDEQVIIVDQIESIFYDYLYGEYCDEPRTLEEPPKGDYEKENLYCFSIS